MFTIVMKKGAWLHLELRFVIYLDFQSFIILNPSKGDLELKGRYMEQL
ncbi:MAG: hypothetical protein PHI36_03500 [Bacteroidales bacterium]|nr:hypothetical protein [Bacteroidales bacterium]